MWLNNGRRASMHLFGYDKLVGCSHALGIVRQKSNVCDAVVPTKKQDKGKVQEEVAKPDSNLGPYQRCYTSPRRSEFKCMSNEVRSIRVPVPIDCLPACPNRDPPLDLKFYKASDKAKREYQQTWIECLPLVRAKRPCCVLKPVYERREFKRAAAGVTSGCSRDPSCMMVSPIKPRCPKVSMPGCKAAREITICRRMRKKDPCRRRQTRYPAYSECQRDAPLPARIVECNCLAAVPTCIMWRNFNKRGLDMQRRLDCTKFT